MTYFDKPSDLAPVTKARSVDINNLAALIAAAFGKLPNELDLKMGTVNYAVNTGPNGAAYAVVMATKITSYIDGLEVRMRPVKDNTGACTLNVNGIGAIAIKRADGTDPQAGDIIGNTPIVLTYQAADNVFHLPAVVNSQIVQAASSSTQAQASAAAAAISAATALKTLAIESDDPPANPIDGQEWIEASSGRRFTYLEGQWAETYVNVVADPLATVDVRRYGILDDGTDQTAALVNLLGTTLAGQRLFVRIPPGIKFTLSTVYAAATVGLFIIDDSSINTGQPPGYRTKSRRMFANDTASDDSIFEVASGHHPAIRLNNAHIAGSASALGSFHSLLFAHGWRWNNDPIDGLQLLVSKSPRGNLWRMSVVLNTPYNFAANGAQQWTAGQAVAIGNLRNTSDGNEYQAASAGNCGANKPVHVAGTVSDGAVNWTYVGKWSAGQTLFYFDEDGYLGFGGFSSARLGAETSSKKGISLNVDDATGDVWIRDDQRGVELFRLSTANGLQAGALRSLSKGAVLSGAAPTISSDLHVVTNAAATNMTNLLLPAGQTRAVVRLYFTNANTTLLYVGGNFNLKGNVSVTPAAGSVMEFMLEPSLSGGWIEMSRNF